MPTVIDGTTGVSQVQPGVVGMDDIAATGTPSSTTFLRGDGSWATISTTPTTDQVLTATAGAAVGAVGTYALCAKFTTGNLTAGATIAGSSLRYAGGSPGSTTAVLSGTPSGTWRIMGFASGSQSISCGTSYGLTMCLRIS